jgi:hypothetical protein
MWLFTRYGFFSVVAGLRNTMLVRARSKDHLARLQRRFPVLLNCKIELSSERDYPCRLVVPRVDWLMVTTELMEDVNYNNFKDQVKASFGKTAMYLLQCYEVWSTMGGGK